MPRTVSIHQPAYLPWLGYFDKLLRSDVFVFMDDVQFEKNSFINRNKIKTPNGPIWLTVPVKVKGHTSSTLLDTEIDARQDWRSKHLKSIAMNYRKAPRFQELFPKLEALYAVEHRTISELCWAQLHFWLEVLGVRKTLLRSSEMAAKGDKSDLVLNLCRELGADHYISGALGRDYLDLPSFEAAGIAVEFQSYQHPTYPQLYGEFVPYLGIVDYLMNTDGAALLEAAGLVPAGES